MRRSWKLDWLLLATLLPLYLLLQTAGIQAHLASGARSLPFVLTRAQGAGGHPIVVGPISADPRIQRGDRLLRIGRLDLRGLSLGSTTNLASRLQSMTRELGASIALDETTRERAGYVFALSLGGATEAAPARR
jgi:hypothetical protein